MKRVFITITILVFIAGLATFSRSIIIRDTKLLENELCLIKAEIKNKNFEAVYKYAKNTVIIFEEKRALLTLFVRRDYLANVDIALNGLLAYANKENAADLSSEVDKAAAQLKMINNLY